MSRDLSRFLNDVEPEQFRFEDDGDIPNHPRFPVIYYSDVVVEEDRNSALILEAIFESNGWPETWRNGVYPYPHYHSNAHEVLGCYSGTAKLRLGGANGVVQVISAGDVVVLPAGVGHENLGSSADFKVVGSYPAGQSPDMCRGGGRAAGVTESISAVPCPSADPVYGSAGLVRIWAGG